MSFGSFKTQCDELFGNSDLKVIFQSIVKRCKMKFFLLTIIEVSPNTISQSSVVKGSSLIT